MSRYAHHVRWHWVSAAWGPLRGGWSLRETPRSVELGIGRLLLRARWGRPLDANQWNHWADRRRLPWRELTFEFVWFDRETP